MPQSVLTEENLASKFDSQIYLPLHFIWNSLALIPEYMQVLLVWDEASSDYVIIRVTEINKDVYQCMMSLNNFFLW